MRAVFLDLQSLDDLDLQPLRSIVSELVCHQQTAVEDVPERIRGFDIVITNKAVLTAETIAQSDSLKLICVVATGVNNVDLDAARQREVPVSNCQGYGTSSVAQHVISLMLALHTRLLDYHKAVGEGRWNRSEQFCLLDYPIQELQGKTLGLVGYGNLGRKVAEIARAFGMKILVAQRAGTEPGQADDSRLPLEELLPLVDVLSLHCPLTDATRNLIDARALRLMKPGSFLINAARGGIVDEPALVNALHEGHLAGAATDVLIEEPPRQGNPLLEPGIPNLIVTPHCAWGSFQARSTILAQAVENIRTFLEQGSPTRRVV